jgi:hypothetical protein
MKTPARKASRRNKPEAVSAEFREQLVVLENFARVLNRDRKHPQIIPPPTAADVAQLDGAVARAVEVVQAAGQSSYPDIPKHAAEAFDRLANGRPVEYTIRNLFGRGNAIQLDYKTRINATSHSHEGIMVVWLVSYFMNPSRDRLRNCPQCSRWFVDFTRNKSSVRCSRACTIAWWSKKGAGR